LAAPQAGAYALKLGPLYISDDSASLRGELKRPKGHLTLYEFDSSPFCRKVRDALTALDLEVDCRPCPGAVAGFSDELFERTGRRTVPYLVDADAGIELFESEAIVDYLYDAYGPGREKTPFFLRGNVALVSAGLAGTVRLLPAAALQVDARLDNIGRQPLSLYGYETSPFVRPVREKLCSLALPHTVVNAARGSVKREELIGRTGKPFQVPYLVDPNTGVELFESVAIRIYLDRVYTTSGYTPLEDAPPQVKTE